MSGQPQGRAYGSEAARTNYTVRVVSFAYCFVVIGMVLWERGAGALAWSLLALQFLVYPQLAYLRAAAAQDSRKAEFGHLYFDSVSLGAWVAMLGFPTWIACAALLSTTLNSALMRGWAGAGCAALCFAAGALAWVAPMGYQHDPATSDLVTALCFLGALAYSAGVGLLVQNQNRRLNRAREELRKGESRYQAVTAQRDRVAQPEFAGLAFENASEAMMISNAAGRILAVNRAFTRITGYEPGETLGQQESKFRSGLQPAAFYDDMYAAVLRAGQWRGTTWCQRRDGTVYREWRSVSAVRDADDRVTHYVTLFGELDGAAADREGGAPREAGKMGLGG